MSNTTILGEDEPDPVPVSSRGPGAFIIVMDNATGQTQQIDAATMQQLIAIHPDSVNIVRIDDQTQQSTPAAPVQDGELILDSETLDRLESALTSDEGGQIFVPNQLTEPVGRSLDDLVTIQSEEVTASESEVISPSRRVPADLKHATRRSQRRADRTLREQAEQIRCENQRQALQQVPSATVAANPPVTGRGRGGRQRQQQQPVGSIMIRYPDSNTPAVKHTGAAVKHTGEVVKHTGAAVKHTGAAVKHTGAAVKHTGAAVKHADTAAFPLSSAAPDALSVHEQITPLESDDALGELISVSSVTAAGRKHVQGHGDIVSNCSQQPVAVLEGDESSDAEPHANEEEAEDEEEDSEGWQSEDDPDKLWCICRQPHNNRFMICCDSCEDWFHGNCVSVTRAMGRQMEESGREWVCPLCRRKQKQREAAEREEAARARQTAALAKRAERQQQAESAKLRPAAATLTTSKRLSTKQPLQARDGRTVVLPAGDPAPSQFCIVGLCENAARAGSIYCSEQCIQAHALESLAQLRAHQLPEPQTPPAHVQPLSAAPSGEAAAGQEVAAVKPLSPLKSPLKGNKVDFQTMLDAGSSASVSKPPSTPPAAPKPLSPQSRVVVFERKSGRILTGSSAPTVDNLKFWLRDHPTFEVLKPGVLPTSKFYGVKKPDAKQLKIAVKRQPDAASKTVLVGRTKVIPCYESVHKTAAASPSPSVRRQLTLCVGGQQPVAGKQRRDSLDDFQSPPAAPRKQSEDGGGGGVRKKKRKEKELEPEPKEKRIVDVDKLRLNVKNMLADVLFERAKNDSKISEDRGDIEKLVDEIESHLFMLHKDVNFKYKAKYRSFMFNLKDTKNRGLFRKVILREIEPSKLVKMSADELASKELAQWREREEKKEIEAIQKHELDLLALGNKFVMKTHKGELEIEKDDSNKTATEVSLPSAIEEFPSRDMLEDSTAQHGHHVFDMKCRICSGKQPPPAPPSKPLETKSNNGRESKSSGSGRHKSSRDGNNHRHDSSRHNQESDRHRTSSKNDSKKSNHHSHKEKRHKDRHRHRSRDHDRSSTKDHSSVSSQRSKTSPSKNSSSRGNHEERHGGHRKSKNRVEGSDRRCSQSSSTLVSRHHRRAKDLQCRSTTETSDDRLNTTADDGVSDTAASEEREKRHHSPLQRSVSFASSVDQEEAISDRDTQPSSTVNIKTPPYSQSGEESDSAVSAPPVKPKKPSSVWRGFITMPDICKFFTQAFEVSGNASQLQADIPDHVQVVGRIAPDTIWGYLRQIRKSNREVVVVRLQPATDEEKLHYAALYSYLSRKDRFGVVGGSKSIKDFYIIPLASTSPVPDALLPFDGIGIDDYRQNMLLGLIVYASRKRKSMETGEATSCSSKPSKVRRSCTKVVEYDPPPAANYAPTASLRPLTIGYQPERSAYRPGHYRRDNPVPISPQASSSPPPSLNFYQAVAEDAELNASLEEVIRQADNSQKRSVTDDEDGVVHEKESFGSEQCYSRSAAGDSSYDPGSAAGDGDGPYDPGSAVDDGSYDRDLTAEDHGDAVDDPTRLLAELNRRISEQKFQIRTMHDQLGDEAPYDPAEFSPTSEDGAAATGAGVLQSLRSCAEQLHRLHDPIVETYGCDGTTTAASEVSPPSPSVDRANREYPVVDTGAGCADAAEGSSQEPRSLDPRQRRCAVDPRRHVRSNLSSLTDADLLAKAHEQLAAAAVELPADPAAVALPMLNVPPPPLPVRAPWPPLSPTVDPYGAPFPVAPHAAPMPPMHPHISLMRHPRMRMRMRGPRPPRFWHHR